MFKPYYVYKVVGSMEDKIKKERRKLKKRKKHLKKSEKIPSKKQILRAIKLSHQLDSMYFQMFK